MSPLGRNDSRALMTSSVKTRPEPLLVARQVFEYLIGIIDDTVELSVFWRNGAPPLHYAEPIIKRTPGSRSDEVNRHFIHLIGLDMSQAVERFCTSTDTTFFDNNYTVSPDCFQYLHTGGEVAA